jgi:hypothetical protein
MKISPRSEQLSALVVKGLRFTCNGFRSINLQSPDRKIRALSTTLLGPIIKACKSCHIQKALSCEQPKHLLKFWQFKKSKQKLLLYSTEARMSIVQLLVQTVCIRHPICNPGYIENATVRCHISIEMNIYDTFVP